MTQQEAKDFLARNPRITPEALTRLQAIADDFHLEKFWDFGAIDCEADAFTDLLEVVKALRSNPNEDPK
jgi:hypothetical protein